MNTHKKNNEKVKKEEPLHTTGASKCSCPFCSKRSSDVRNGSISDPVKKDVPPQLRADFVLNLKERKTPSMVDTKELGRLFWFTCASCGKIFLTEVIRKNVLHPVSLQKEHVMWPHARTKPGNWPKKK
jgi:hypothetical protein